MNAEKICKFVIPTAVSLSMLLTEGCAVMSEDECRATNWNDKGYQDGMQYMGADQLQEYISACHKYVTVDSNAYNAGRKQAAAEFCTEDNGFALGKNGTDKNDLCNLSSNTRNFDEYFSRGRLVYNASQELANIDKMISDIDGYMDLPLGNIREQLRDNDDYLRRVRTHAADYYDYVNNNAYGGNVEVTSFSRDMQMIPYPDALTKAQSASNLINQADKTYDEIDQKLEFMKCDDQDDKQAHKCMKQRDCIYREKDNLRDRVDRAIRSGSGNVDFNKWYQCMW